jgi:hypothetical protein
VYAKLDWATTRHDEMLDRFEGFVKSGGDERPYGIKFTSMTDRVAWL